MLLECNWTIRFQHAQFLRHLPISENLVLCFQFFHKSREAKKKKKICISSKVFLRSFTELWHVLHILRISGTVHVLKKLSKKKKKRGVSLHTTYLVSLFSLFLVSVLL